MSEQSTDQSATSTGEAGSAAEAPSVETLQARIAELENDRDKYKGLMRSEETKKKDLFTELQQIKQAGMSETEKAIAEAEARGREAALAELDSERKALKLKVAAATAGVPDGVLDLLDTSKVFVDGEVAIDRLSALAGSKPPKFQKSAADLGIGAQSNTNSGQLTRDHLKGKSHKEIMELRRAGRLDALMKGELT